MVFFIIIVLKFACQSITFYLRSKYLFYDIGEDVDDVFFLFKKFECLSIDDQMQAKERLFVVEDLFFEGDE